MPMPASAASRIASKSSHRKTACGPGAAPARVTKHVRPAQQVGAVQFVNQPMAGEVFRFGRYAVTIEIGRSGDQHSVLRCQLGRDEGAVGKFADPDHGIEPLQHGISKPFGEIEFDREAGMIPHDRFRVGTT